MPPKKAAKKPAAKAKSSAKPAVKEGGFKPTIEDGVFISARMRREADATAKAEVAQQKLDAEKVADDMARNTYESDPAYAAKSDAEKTHLAEKALYQATEEARAANGLETDADRKAKEAKAAADALKAQDAAAKAAAKAAKKKG